MDEDIYQKCISMRQKFLSQMEERMDNLGKMNTLHHQMIERQDQVIANMKDMIDHLQRQLDMLARRYDTLENELKITDGNFEFQEKRIDDLEKSLGQYEGDVCEKDDEEIRSQKVVCEQLDKMKNALRVLEHFLKD